MSTTTNGSQLSPCVELFIELLLDEASAVSSREVSIVRQPQDVAAHCRTGLPPNALMPEKVDERFAASCRQCPRWPGAVESIEDSEGEVSITAAIWQLKGKPDLQEKEKD
jgi:hypothetical protein